MAIKVYVKPGKVSVDVETPDGSLTEIVLCPENARRLGLGLIKAGIRAEAMVTPALAELPEAGKAN